MPKYQRKCKECGEKFDTNRKDRRFCCEKCRNKNWIRDHPRLVNNGDPNNGKE